MLPRTSGSLNLQDRCSSALKIEAAEDTKEWLPDCENATFHCLTTKKSEAVKADNNIMTVRCLTSKFWTNVIRKDADKSLVLPTSWCHRTESIVPLERRVCSCAELQVFSSYRGLKEARQATRAISTTSRRELSSGFFFLQGKAPKEIHAILIVTLEEHAPSYAPVKNWVA